MPIVIGAKQESDFTDPIGMLGDCHRRIERFLAVLRKLASQRQGAALSEQERTALSGSLQYFREAAPKHTADEEESLFPRMRAADPAATRVLFERIDALESDHKTAVKVHAEVDALGQIWLSRGSLCSDEASQLQALLGQLAALYELHIALEDSEVFPSAAQLLSSSDRRAISLEMAARRGLSDRIAPVSKMTMGRV
jgi:hemerythrin-like domain-containing protein